MWKYAIILIILLSSICIYLWSRISVLNDKYEVSVENMKAYESILSTSESNNRVFKLTIEQLNYSKDSVLQKMKKVQKELGIKNQRLEQLQYDLSLAERQDTLVLKDTIFRDPRFKLDTVIGDKWFKTNLYLEYPGTIALKPEIELEKYTFIVGNRETINPPNKFFLFRWFQKRHTVVEVSIKERNPYVRVKEQRFIKILK